MISVNKNSIRILQYSLIAFLIIYTIAVTFKNAFFYQKQINFLPRLETGIDLSGGHEMIIQVEPYETEVYLQERNNNNDILTKAILVLENRLNGLGTKDINTQRYGSDKIVIVVPSSVNIESIKSIINTTAHLTFHILNPYNISYDFQTLKNKISSQNEAIMPGYDENNKSYYLLSKKADLDGKDIVNAIPANDGMGNGISFKFNKNGCNQLSDVTRRNIGKAMAIALDGKVLMAPVINAHISNCSGSITGNFSYNEASKIALLLKSGSLPAKLKIIDEKEISSSLGIEILKSAKIASLFGILAIMLFMFIRYKGLGIVASFALFLNLTITITIMAICGFNITLPGIAGLVLMLGMAVDANVIIYEKMIEIYKNNIHTPSIIIKHGFSDSMSAILDSNLTTIIAATVLFGFGNSFIKGFAVTLIIGVMCSAFTAIILTKIIIKNLIPEKFLLWSIK